MPLTNPLGTLAVQTPDGLSVAAQIWSANDGPELLLIHGMLQSHLCWAKQDALAQSCRLVTYDFRGHGSSEKKISPEFYNEGARFADELKAVIETAGLKKPVLAGWSFGTRIIADYLLKFGGSGIAGVVFIAPVLTSNRAHFGPGIKKLVQARDPNLFTSIQGLRGFLEACFGNRPPQDDFETMLAFNASVPIEIRGCFRRPGDDEAVQACFRALNRPVLFVHGAEDRVVSPEVSRLLAPLIQGAELSIYEECGHAPFYEQPERFNRELLSFVARAAQGRSA